jgi:hypothetical protein
MALHQRTCSRHHSTATESAHRGLPCPFLDAALSAQPWTAGRGDRAPQQSFEQIRDAIAQEGRSAIEAKLNPRRRRQTVVTRREHHHVAFEVARQQRCRADAGAHGGRLDSDGVLPHDGVSGSVQGRTARRSAASGVSSPIEARTAYQNLRTGKII